MLARSKLKVQGSQSARSKLELGTWNLEPALAAIRRRWDCEATTAVILGTGLGDLAEEVSAEASLSYLEIPGFPRSTALAHKGRLVCGRLGGQPVVVLQGRCHLYEGYRHGDLALPVRVLAALGIETLMVTNAAGGLNPDFSIGDVMLIDDHVNLMGVRALGTEDEGQGANMASFQVQAASAFGRARCRGRYYDCGLAAAAEAIARRNEFPLRRGVYVGVTGPSYETRAEYRAFRRIGGDAVGMSTIPEVLAAAACGLRVLGLSTITNVARPDAPQVVSAEEVVAVAELALPRVRAIVRGVLSPPPGHQTSGR